MAERNIRGRVPTRVSGSSRSSETRPGQAAIRAIRANDTNARSSFRRKRSIEKTHSFHWPGQPNVGIDEAGDRASTGDSPGRPQARRTASDDRRVGLVVDPLPKVHAGDDLDGDDRGEYPVDDHAEGWPPPRVENEVGAVLTEAFEAVTDEAAFRSRG
jgi:hypothetical protein